MFFSQCILESQISSDEKKIARVETGDADQCEKACSDRGTECVGWTWTSGPGGCDLFHSLLEEERWTKTAEVTSGLMKYGDCPAWASTTTKGNFRSPEGEQIMNYKTRIYLYQGY